MVTESLRGENASSEASEGTGKPPGAADRRQGGRTDLGLLVLIGVLFLAFRLPLMYRQPGGVDEGDFSVPGCTILEEGIPRIPYVPSRNPRGFFYRADEAVLLLPPLYFYWQAGFYALFSPSYGTARLASGAAAILAFFLLYAVGRRLTGSRAAALWGAGLYSLSRVCFFPAMAARPDMLCGMLGLTAVWALLRWRDRRRLGWLMATAAAIGLGGLAHPFAIIYAVPLGIWVLLAEGRWWQRLGYLVLLVAGAILVFSLWLFLIVPYFETFCIQFFNNVLDRSGPGLLDRLVSPWDAIRWQCHLIIEHAGPIQTAVMFAGLAIASVAAIGNRERNRLALAALAWSSIAMLVLFAGTHATKGYWCYPGAWLFLCAGGCIAAAGERIGRCCSRWNLSAALRRTTVAVGSVGLLMAMLPGSGIQAWVAHVRHWKSPDWDARQFTQMLLAHVPRQARVVVDGGYILPFYLDGRDVVLAGSYDLAVPDDYLPYDYYVSGRESIDKGFPQKLGGRLVQRFGDKDNIMACYAELYVSGEVAGAAGDGPLDQAELVP